MSSGAVRAGLAFVEIGAKDEASSVLDKVSAKLNSFGKGLSVLGAGMAGVGTAVVAPILAMAVSFADAGSQVDDMSQRTGMSAEAISSLGYAAEQSGTNMETLEKSALTMGKNLEKAFQGNKEAIKTIEGLGLSVSQLEGMTVEERFIAISDSLSKIEDPGKRAAMAMKIFGKGGAAMLPMLADGAEGIRAMQREADRLNLTISTEDAQSAAAFGDAIDTVKSTIQGMINSVGASLAPLLTETAKLIADVISTVARWASQNRGLVQTIFVLGAGLVAAGTAIGGLGVAMMITGSIITGFVAIAGVVSSAIATIGLPVAAAVAAIAILGGALLASIASFFAFTDSGHAALGFLKNSFVSLWNFIKPILGAITTALKGGDWQLAAQIAWAGLKAVFWKGAAQLDNVVFALGVGMIKTFSSALTKISFMMVKFVASFAKALDQIKSMDLSGAMATMSPGNLAKQLSQLTGPQALSAFNKYAEGQSAKANAELQALMDESAKYAPPTPPPVPAPPVDPTADQAADPSLPDQAIIDDAQAKMDAAQAQLDSLDQSPQLKPDPHAYDGIVSDLANKMGKAIDTSSIDDLGLAGNVPDASSLDATAAPSGSGESKTGTFSSYAAALMGAGAGGGSMDRVAKSSERQERTLEKIDKNIEILSKMDGLTWA